MNQLSRTKKITLSALITALSVVYTLFMPTIDLGVWSFTPFSHMFVFLGVFLSPYVGIMTTLGVLGGFFLKGAQPLVLLRAFSHIFFVLYLIIVMRKISPNTKKGFFFLCATAALVHAAFEIVAVLVGILIALPVNQSAYYILGVTGGGTLIHSIVDFSVAFFLFKVVQKAFRLEP